MGIGTHKQTIRCRLAVLVEESSRASELNAESTLERDEVHTDKGRQE
jgi:hypothetical protein